MKKFLQAKDIGVGLLDLLHHSQSCLAALIIVPLHFNEAGYIPGGNRERRSRLCIPCFITGKVESKEDADAPDAKDEYDCRNERQPFLYKQPADHKQYGDRKQKWKPQSEYRNEPPLVRIQSGRQAGQQEKYSCHHIQKNQDPFCKYPNLAGHMTNFLISGEMRECFCGFVIALRKIDGGRLFADIRLITRKMFTFRCLPYSPCSTTPSPPPSGSYILSA